MQKLHEVMYDAIPEKVTVFATSVMVVTDCKEVEVEDEMSGAKSTKYQCEVEQYTTAEYIDTVQKKMEDVEAQATTAMMGLTEVYEMML